MGPVSEPATSVVRLSPGHPDSVICFSELIVYEKTRLDPDLIADLQAWDVAYSAGLPLDHSWRSLDIEADFYTAGAQLAQRVADPIGDAFRVQYDRGETQRRVRGGHPARIPEAAATFARMADDARAEWADLSEAAARAWRDRDADTKINEPFGSASWERPARE